MRHLAVIVTLMLVLSSVVNGRSFERLHPELDSRYAPEAGSTEEGLWMSMDAYEEKIKHSQLRVTDPELNAYVTDLACDLAMEYCTDIRVYVVRAPDFNAFMAPNGMMIINTGLLLRSKNSAQLATVIGHELGHYLRKHSLKRLKNLKSTSSFSAILGLGLAAGAATGNVAPGLAVEINDLSQFLLLASIFHYSREDEHEADKYGIQLMSDIRLDTREAAYVWRQLIAEQESSEEGKVSRSMLSSTHPADEERAVRLEKYAELLQFGATGPESRHVDRYHEIVRPHIRSWIKDELRLYQFGRSVYVLNGLLDRGISPGLVNFFLGELYRKRGGDGDVEIARKHFQTAMDLDWSIPELHRSLGMFYLKDKDHDTANRFFSNYLSLSPDAKDRKMIEFYLSMGE